MTRLTFLAAAVASACALTGCGGTDTVAPPDTQYGSHPALPAPQEYLLPPMKIAPAGS